ncbi:MAG: hypothetical protein ACLR5Q_11555 [Coprococcus sp.]
MELLDVVDENGIPTGETVERSIAHAKGIRHRTSHVWLLRRRSEGVEVLLQKRSDNKDSFPGCYDTSSAGIFQRELILKIQHCGNSGKNWTYGGFF